VSLRGHDVTAIDPSESDIEFLNKNDINGFYGSSVAYQVGRGEDLQFPDATFDVVTCVSVLEHIPPGNDRLSLWEVARVLKPNGKLIITFDVAPPAVAQDGEEPWPRELRRYTHPFSPQAVKRLYMSMSSYFGVGTQDLPRALEGLTWDDVHEFWRASQDADARSESVREYLAMGSVLTRRDTPIKVAVSNVAAAYAEGQAALAERLQYFELHARRRLEIINDLTARIADMEAELEKKEQVIDELDKAASERLSLINTLHTQAEVVAGAVRNELVERLPSATLADVAARVKFIETSVERQLDVLNQLSTTISDASGLLRDATRDADVHMGDRLRVLQRELDAAQAAADARLTVIRQQQRTIETYKWGRPRDLLANWTAPRIGQLYQYAPKALRIPARYTRVRPPSNAPSLSIVTPSFNQGVFIERTVQSVLSQGYPKLEYIIKDACSSDETMAVLKHYERQLAHLESTPDTGFGNGINIGFRRATGEIMAYLNSDDLLLPGTLNYVARYFVEHPTVDVVYGHRVIIDEYDSEIGRWVLPPHDDNVLSWADYVPQETLFWRRSIWEKAGGTIDESFRFAIDWDLLIRFRDAGATMVRLPRFLGAFRVHPHQKTSAEMEALGTQEMNRLRERCLGKRVRQEQINRAVGPYLRRHFVVHKLYRLGLLRY
jgi:hypothetical protein